MTEKVLFFPLQLYLVYISLGLHFQSAKLWFKDIKNEQTTTTKNPAWPWGWVVTGRRHERGPLYFKKRLKKVELLE